ncbi:hypothetical protein BUALT_Bualt14G0046000 [Buddleja alternifolia]|uniref:Protein FAR1-RELATED SEQUENCE n=1 Tax=Buddleja alternifolia TaxID=168488 RepID=A0AAV6WGL6_9LAMI|nr:hypothetical protein BUALT_Bualt14G0046000 [Buddleja alternifolia]
MIMDKGTCDYNLTPSRKLYFVVDAEKEPLDNGGEEKVGISEWFRPTDKRDVNVTSHRPETRNGCGAMMKVVGRYTGKYKVVNFIADHSGHDLVSPSKTHLLRSHRSITIALASQANDMESTFDEDDLIANIFWVDAQMMADYVFFGDVVCFDTTYRKNKEGRPFALFVGVNHYKKTIVFSATLLYNETASTSIWLVDTFARAMSGKQPLTILTDQDTAMAKALAETWPATCHRLCIWHIYQNAAIHLSSVFAHFTDFSKALSYCIYDYEEKKLIDDRRYEELKVDLRTSRTITVASFLVEILKHATSVYTHEVFKLFQDELRKAYDAKKEYFGEVGEISDYKITPFDKHRQHTVILTNKLVTRASLTKETFKIAKNGILKLLEDVDANLENRTDITLTRGKKLL